MKARMVHIGLKFNPQTHSYSSTCIRIFSPSFLFMFSLVLLPTPHLTCKTRTHAHTNYVNFVRTDLTVDSTTLASVEIKPASHDTPADEPE